MRRRWAFGRAMALVGAVAAALAAPAQTGPRPWQQLQMPSVAELRAHWVTPAPEYGPEPYYGLNGPATLDTVRHDLDTMQALGFRAVTVQYGFGSDRPYLSEPYLQFFRAFVQEVKQRHMRLWIVDDAGYPSGFAGGKFTSEHPELRMQALVVGSTLTPEAGATVDEAVPPQTVAVTALDMTGKVVTLPFPDGRIHWTVPAGSWRVLVVEHAFRTSPTRSDTNPKRVKDGSQSLEDYLDPAATAQFLAFTHEAYKRVVGDEFGKTILGFRGDEPDFSISGLPWTPAFFARFEKQKGYDIRPYLALFLQPKTIELNPEQLRAKADYYDVFADMFRDGFFKPQGEWCAANGLEYQVHLNHEEQQIALAHSEGDFFRDMRYVQVPGIDTIWHQIWTDTISDFPRFASSAAHVYGHPRAFTESFAAYRPLPDVHTARYILNEQMVRGINLVETMYFPSSSSPNGGGPMPFMRDPDYPDLMHYTARMSYLLSQGRPAAQVALLLPAESLWMGDTRADNTFVSTERLLSEHQVEFDIVGEDAIGHDMALLDGAFVSGSEERYRTVLVPDATLLPGAVVQRLQQFANGGGHVVFLGAVPAFVGAANDLHAKPATAMDFGWAAVLPGELPVTPTPPAQPPSAAPAPMTGAAEWMARLEVYLPVPPLQLSTPQTGLRCLQRRLRDGMVYFFFNESANPIATEVTLRGAGRQAEVWDAEAGTTAAMQSLASHEAHGTLHLSLALAPYATKLLVVH